ncbi:MAG: Ig-like domain-containing protein [Ruminiclostridium sp.]|nr:Ig-like domain-containing protein [Ruminiclostridium sp.]
MLIARAEGYDLGAERYLVAFDKLECIPELVGEVPLDTLTLACDREGSFYSGECGTTNIYKYTLDAVTGSAKPQLVLNMMEQLEMTDEELASGRSSIQSMEWDPNNDILCWTLYSTQIESYYFEIDPETKEVEPSDWLEDQLCALIIPDQSTTPEIPDWAEDAKVTTIFTTAEMSSMYMSTTQKVTAEFLPWTAESAEIEWVSSDEDVLTVDSYGNVTAVGVGTAKIYAYLKGDHSVFDYVEIESEMPQVLLKGALQDVDGSPMLYTWNMSKDLTWTGGAALKGDMSAGTLNKNNGHIYTISSDGTTVREIDPKDGSEVAAYPCTLGASGVTLWDMTYSDMFSDDDRFSVYAIYGSTVLIDYDPTTGEKPMGFDADDMGLFMMTGAEYFVAIANLGEGTIDATREEDEEERILPTERIALLDNLNYLWIFEFFYDEDEDGPYLDFDFRLSESHSINEKYPLAFKYDEVASMVLGDDGYVYLSAVSDDSCNLYQLDVQLWEEYDDYYEQNVKYVDYTAKKMGSSGDKVWPMLLTSAEGTIVTETDEATGITVTYTFIAEGVNLSVKTLDSSDTTVSYDIKLVDADGENVDPDGKVVVEIPVPEGMNAENAAVYVLNEDGTYTKVDAELVDGVFVFTTNKLGVYAVSTEKLDEIQEPDVTTSPEETTTSGDTANDPDNNKPTGIVIAIVPAVVSAAAVMVTKRRNRK